MKVHFSSKTVEWATPSDLFNEINEEFHLNLDVCANTSNHKLSMWFSVEEDGLSKDWQGSRCWMNPPYGREIGKWVAKAAQGGGRNYGGLTSRAHRHKVVPPVYLRESRDPFSKRPIEVWRFKELSPIS